MRNGDPESEATMSTLELIPPPKVVREQLAHNLREARLLRKLLTLSERAAAERQQFPLSQNDRRAVAV